MIAIIVVIVDDVDNYDVRGDNGDSYDDDGDDDDCIRSSDGYLPMYLLRYIIVEPSIYLRR